MENKTENKMVLEKVKNNLQSFFADYNLFKDTIEALEINDKSSAEKAGEFRKKLSDFLYNIEQYRKSEVAPFNKLVKEINAQYKIITSKFEELQQTIDDKLKGYLIAEAKRKEEWAKKQREKELAEMEKEKEELAKKAGEDDLAFEMLKNISLEKEKIEQQKIIVRKSVGEEIKTGIRDNWKFKITNSEEVPYEYCEPSERKIRIVLKNNLEKIKTGEFKIPGIEFYNEPVVYNK